MKSLSPSRIYAATALFSALLITYALALQHFENLEPCPLCILQRYAFFGVALCAALAAGLGGLRSMIAAATGLMISMVGIGTAIWQIRLQFAPPEVASCGPGLDYLINNLPLSRALPRIFQGGADCAEITWRFMGLTMPMWSLLWLVILSAMIVVALSGSRTMRNTADSPG